VSPCRGEGESVQTHRATADVALLDFPKAVAVCARLVYLAERDVHKVVAVDEVSIERFSVLELDQLKETLQVTAASDQFKRKFLPEVNKGTHHRLVLCGIEK
jgi:hypothetical protein